MAFQSEFGQTRGCPQNSCLSFPLQQHQVGRMQEQLHSLILPIKYGVKILNSIVLYFIVKECTLEPLSMRHMCAVQVRVQYKHVCYTSNLGRPKAHNTIHVNSPPQTQGGCETNLRLSTKSRRRPLGCDLVKIPASCSLEEIEKSLRALWRR